jgi:hypothetical protein
MSRGTTKDHRLGLLLYGSRSHEKIHTGSVEREQGWDILRSLKQGWDCNDWKVGVTGLARSVVKRSRFFLVKIDRCIEQ